MKRFLGILWLCATLFGAGAAHAQIDNATAESLLRKSGLWEQLASITAQTDAGLADAFAKAGVKLSAAEIDRLKRAMRDAFAAERLRLATVKVVSAKLNERHVVELQQWYESPVGQAVTRLEEKESAEISDPQVRMQQGFQLLEKLPPARRQLLQSLLKETRAAEAMAQTTINTNMAVLRGLASVMPAAPAMSQKELRAQLEAQRPQMMQAFSAIYLAVFARTYAPLSQEQLRLYVAFLESGAGNHFTAVCMEALDAALTEGAVEFGRRLPSSKDQANT